MTLTGSLRQLASPLPTRWRRRFLEWLCLPPLWYFRWKFPPLILRPGTTDPHVFLQVFFSRHFLHLKPALIVDGGAYAGYSALWFAWKYPHARVIAIEPEESNYRVLAENVRPYPRITALHRALWPEQARLEVVAAGSGHWGFRTEAAAIASLETVQAVTIPDLLKDGERIGILKLDIEGAERELFSGDCSWIDQVDAIIIELHGPACEAAVRKAAASAVWDESRMGEYLVLTRK